MISWWKTNIRKRKDLWSSQQTTVASMTATTQLADIIKLFDETSCSQKLLTKHDNNYLPIYSIQAFEEANKPLHLGVIYNQQHVLLTYCGPLLLSPTLPRRSSWWCRPRCGRTWRGSRAGWTRCGPASGAASCSSGTSTRRRTLTSSTCRAWLTSSTRPTIW